jgi:molybdate transport system substrate-binding protein
VNKAVFTAILTTVVFLTGCSGDSVGRRDEVLVFAAVSVTNALNEAVALYETASETNVTISYAGSQILAQQIASGAPAQLFVSAGESPVQFLRERSMVGSEVGLIANKLVVITRTSLEEQSLFALSSPKVERIALADPDLAPAGSYSREALRAAGLWESLQPKIVLGQDVRSTMAFVEAGNADVALVYATDAAIARGVETLDIVPHDSYGPIVYPIVTVKSEGSTEAADAFVKFLLSPDAQEIFLSHGFEPVR